MRAAVLPALEVGLAGLVGALVFFRQALPGLVGLLGIGPVALVARVVGRPFLAHGGLLCEAAMPPARRRSAKTLIGKIFRLHCRPSNRRGWLACAKWTAVSVGGCHVE